MTWFALRPKMSFVISCRHWLTAACRGVEQGSQLAHPTRYISFYLIRKDLVLGFACLAQAWLTLLYGAFNELLSTLKTLPLPQISKKTLFGELVVVQACSMHMREFLLNRTIRTHYTGGYMGACLFCAVQSCGCNISNVNMAAECRLPGQDKS